MKIAVDENIPFAEETFGRHGELVTFAGRSLTADQLVGIDALITRSVTKVNADLLAQHQPAFVGTCTIGTDHLDIAFLDETGVNWAYAPGCNAQSVVDYVLAVMATLKPNELPNTVGIVGCGNVGGRLRQRMLSMGLDVRVYDPFLSSQQIPELSSLQQVFQSDLVCLHTPYTETGAHPTAGMISLDQLQLLPTNALLISAGRGGVVREVDLKSLMLERPDIHVALDVWQSEPCIDAGLLQEVDIATPHIAGYSLEGKRLGTLQIYAAFCAHFAVEQVTDVAKLQPVDLAQPALSPDSWAEYVLAVYQPTEDTRRMRESFAQSNGERLVSGQWFDELRRHYPERRELGSFRLAAESLSSELTTKLERCGFNLQSD